MAHADRDDACLGPDDVVALQQAALEPAALRALESHVATCAACRALLSSVDPGRSPAFAWLAATQLASPSPAPLEPLLVPGTRLGRYVVSSQLGEGAMGVVYAAYDPELERKIALKILRARGDQTRRREALHREAQAMAKLAHPNVVAVYDVGAAFDHIFIAMEMVDGQTLAAWLDDKPRGWREVVPVFTAAGRGLAAAHSAGLVHRDFKPANVLVGRDGRVRVSDFGLAQSQRLADGSHDALPSPVVVAAGSDRSGSVHGGPAGTPYFMAPEQFVQRTGDARSDQFSFGVALYTAIVGRHPFAGAKLDEIATAVSTGRREPPPDRKVLPRWLLAVIRRSTALDPAERYPTMEALLAALDRDPARRRIRIAAGAGIALAIAAAAIVVTRGADNRMLCAGADRKWDGIWDAARAQAVTRAFQATGKPYAVAAAGHAVHALDGYRTAWGAMRTEACEATRIRHDQSEDMLDRRMLCLDAGLRDARALIDRLAAADVDTVEHAAAAVGSLGDLKSCRDAQALSSQVAPPVDPETRGRVAELGVQLAELKALRIAGHTREARTRIAPLVERARAIGYRPFEAEALYEQAEQTFANGEPADAGRAAEQAVWAAEAGRVDEIAARAWILLMKVRQVEGRYDDGVAIARRVTAVIERLSGNDDLAGSLHAAVAYLLIEAGRIEPAKAEADQARAILERRFGPDDLRVADALSAQGRVATIAGDRAAATGYIQRELEIRRHVLGDEHPSVAMVMRDAAVEQAALGHYEEALATLAPAQRILDRAVDPNHPSIAMMASSYGKYYAALGKFEQAVVAFRKAVDIARVAYGPTHQIYATFLMDLGDALDGLERYGEAMTALQEACPIIERRFGPHNVRIGICLEFLARVQFGQKHELEARDTVARAVDMYVQTYGRDNTHAQQALLLLGQLELRLHAPERALGPLERGYAVGSETDPAVWAEIEGLLGRALVDTKRDPVRGRALIQKAKRVLEHDSRVTPEEIRDIDTPSIAR